jgi:nicotinate-nucleotide adenylyltransferase
MKQRIGVFGGTFDPVHRGHIHASRKIVAELELEQLNLVPAYQPVHRDSPAASSAQRLEMLNLAIQNEAGLAVDAREINREGPSYSLLTLLEYRELYPDACLYFILGSDAVSQFDSWYRWQEFLDVVNLVILPRPGFELVLPGMVEKIFRSKWQEDITQFKHSQAGQVYLSKEAMLTQSATDIRKILANTRSAHEMLSKSVHEYILEHKLYSKDLIE